MIEIIVVRKAIPFGFHCQNFQAENRPKEKIEWISDTDRFVIGMVQKSLS